MSFIESIYSVIDTAPQSREAALSPLRGKRCYLYGAGIVGITLQAELAAEGIEIAGFLDDNPDLTRRPEGVPVYRPHEISDAGSCVVVTFRLLDEKRRDALYARLRELGFSSVYYYMPFLANLYVPDRIKESREKIVEAAALFHDGESQAVFRGFLSCAMSRSMDAFPAPTAEEQYHPSLPFAKGLARVVDCGAYDGDTAMRYAHRAKGTLREIALFEPDIKMYARMVKNIGAQPRDFRTFAFPCGVFDKNTSLLFDAVEGGGSTVTETGSTLIQCVRLDDALAGFAPTCVKMDIEGSEYAALQGARSILTEYAPDLSICAYHKLEDIWELPLLIHSINPTYSFFLRSHYMYGMETVLYCIAREEA